MSEAIRLFSCRTFGPPEEQMETFGRGLFR